MTTRDSSAIAAQLHNLLDIVGPTDAAALLTQLQADLMTCDIQIAAAIPSGDMLAIRRASHNLTALAGTAGASRLQQLAEEMNRLAHAKDPQALAGIAPAARAELASLTRLIHDLATDRGAG